MTIEKRTRPYELLVRWGANGIAGAHVQFIEEIVEDDVVLSAKTGDALPLSMAGGAGFPLQDVLSQQLIDTHSTIDTLRGELADSQQARRIEVEQLHAEIAKVQAAGDQARSELSKVEAALAQAVAAPRQ